MYIVQFPPKEGKKAHFQEENSKKVLGSGTPAPKIHRKLAGRHVPTSAP